MGSTVVELERNIHDALCVLTGLSSRAVHFHTQLANLLVVSGTYNSMVEKQCPNRICCNYYEGQVENTLAIVFHLLFRHEVLTGKPVLLLLHPGSDKIWWSSRTIPDCLEHF